MALSTMRRHRRWLYVFLWIVILGFIALLHPRVQERGMPGAPGETLATVGGETDHRRASSREPTCGSGSSTSACTRAA